MRKRPLTPAYVIFYILFLPDTWRILTGIIISVLAVPYIVKPEMGTGARIMLYVMMTGIGYAASGVPGRKIASLFKRLILGSQIPPRRQAPQKRGTRKGANKTGEK